MEHEITNTSTAKQDLEAAIAFGGFGNEQPNTMADFVRELNSKKVEIQPIKSTGDKLANLDRQYEAENGFTFNMRDDGSVVMRDIDGTVYFFNRSDGALTVVRKTGQPERFTATAVDGRDGREFTYPQRAGFQLRDFGGGNLTVEFQGSELHTGFHERWCKPYPPPEGYFTTPYFMYFQRRTDQLR